MKEKIIYENTKRSLVTFIGNLEYGELFNVGNELFRIGKMFNININPECSKYNKVYKEMEEEDMEKEFNRVLKKYDIEYKKTKNSVPCIYMIISCGNDYFTENGWVMGEKPPEKIQCFMDEAYNYVKENFGYDDGSNILGAVCHYDETHPHLQLIFMPITDYYKKIRMLRINNRNRFEVDKDGNFTYDDIHLDKPELNKTKFFSKFRNGCNQMYITEIRDDIYEKFGRRYGLEIGEGQTGHIHASKVTLMNKEADKLINGKCEIIRKLNEDILDRNIDFLHINQKIEKANFMESQIDERIKSKEDALSVMEEAFSKRIDEMNKELEDKKKEIENIDKDLEKLSNERNKCYNYLYEGIIPSKEEEKDMALRFFMNELKKLSDRDKMDKELMEEGRKMLLLKGKYPKLMDTFMLSEDVKWMN